MSSTDQQQVSPNIITQPAQTVANTVPPAPNGTLDSLQCQWVGCGDRAASAEQLYEHVCERHVGRKSTNNLNLTCGWGNCRTATVKRDHITSHIRVHVPLKPHKCDFCGKSFKRPQDLKKHVKTHADDSVIMHSPEPTSANRQHHHGAGGYNMGNQQRGTGFYNESSIQSNVPMAYGYQGHTGSQGYYAPTAQQSSVAYGPVYYNVNSGADVGNTSFDGRKRGFDTLNEFFGDAKRRNFDPSSYTEVGNRLLAFQGVQLPIPLGGGSMGDYSIQGMVNTQGGSVYGPAASHGYALPPMPNLRTKNDLTAIDHILEQMTGSAYENAGSINASGVAHPGTQHTPTGISFRHSNSPPGSLQLPRNHMAAASNHGSTPDLTPGSTVMSYSSGHSPSSSASNSGMSPSLNGASMYPTLPTTATSNPNMAPSSNLGTQFDQDIRRRHSGGALQKAQPARGAAVKVKHEDDPSHEDSMDVDDPPTSSADTPIFTHTNVSSSKISKHNIDPALAGAFDPSDGSDSPTPPAVATGEVDETWVENMRLLEALKAFVKGRLERGEWEDEDADPDADPEANGEMLKNEEMGMGGGMYPVLRSVDVGGE